MDLRIYGDDDYEALTHIPGPYVNNLVSVDDHFSNWYRQKFGNNIDRGKVLPLLRDSKGHLDSGRLWGYLTTQVLKKMGILWGIKVSV